MPATLCANALLRRYVHGPGTDEPLAQYDGAGTTSKKYLHADARGSIIALSDSSGNVVAKNAYDPYGAPQAGNTGLFQYTGQIWLAEAGLYHYKARAYHPGLGRFLQTDPIGFSGGMNFYAYAGDDPINATDPTGLTPADFSCDGPGGCITVTATRNDFGPPANWSAVSITTLPISFRPGGEFNDGAGGDGSDQGRDQNNNCSGTAQGYPTLPPGIRINPITGAAEAEAGEAAINPLLAVIALPFLLLSGDTPQPDIPIYRAVGSAELTNIFSTTPVAFRPAPGGIEGKQFFLSLQGVMWAPWLPRLIRESCC